VFKNTLKMDALKVELFEIKQKFLREIPHYKLIAREIKSIEFKCKIRPTDFEEIQSIKINDSIKKEHLKDYLENHINAELALKHKIALTETFKGLNDHLKVLYQLKIQLLKKLQSYLQVSNNLPDKDIKMSTIIDPYKVIKTIDELMLDENQIKDYLCDKLTVVKPDFDPLLEACLRANKIILHG